MAPGRREPRRGLVALTISGAQLAIMLSWLEGTGKLQTAATEPKWTIDEVRWDLDGLRDLMHRLSETDLGNIPVEPSPMFRLLSHFAADLSARLGAIDNEEKILEGATVTIGAPAAGVAR